MWIELNEELSTECKEMISFRLKKLWVKNMHLLTNLGKRIQ
jgi:hypothetical protein